MDSKNETLERLGLIVQKKRKELKLSQDELGKMVEASQMTIQRLENGFGGTRIETLVGVADKLNTRLTDLFSEIEHINLNKVDADKSSKYLLKKLKSLNEEKRKIVLDIVDKIISISNN